MCLDVKMEIAVKTQRLKYTEHIENLNRTRTTRLDFNVVLSTLSINGDDSEPLINK